MQRVYRILLRLYSPEYRAEFADEMAAVFEQGAREHRSKGRADFAAFLIREYAGLLVGALKDQPRSVHVAPTVGGIGIAALLHAGLYMGLFRLWNALTSAVGRAVFSVRDGREEVLAVTLCGVTTLLCLMPLFFLLNIRLLHRRR